MLTMYTVRVTEVVADPAQGGAPENVFVVPNNSAFHLLIKNQGPAAITVHQDGAFITPLPDGAAVLRTFRTPGRFSVQSPAEATVEITGAGGRRRLNHWLTVRSEKSERFTP